MFSRANAEMTLSSIPFLSSPIDAKRKSSNSGAKTATGAERVISANGCHCLCRTVKAPVT
jgi:hypothetical protein